MVDIQRVRDPATLASIGDGVFDDTITPELIASYLDSPGHHLVVALDGEVVVGMCSAVVHHRPDEPPELYIAEVGTASTHRRRGIGSRLTEAMLEWGSELGCRSAWLATEADNDPALGLYDGMIDRYRGGRQSAMIYSFELDAH